MLSIKPFVLFTSEKKIRCSEIYQHGLNSIEFDPFYYSKNLGEGCYAHSISYAYYEAHTFTFLVTRYFFLSFSSRETIPFFERKQRHEPRSLKSSQQNSVVNIRRNWVIFPRKYVVQGVHLTSLAASGDRQVDIGTLRNNYEMSNARGCYYNCNWQNVNSMRLLSAEKSRQDRQNSQI